jgi:hypothetical protein
MHYVLSLRFHEQSHHSPFPHESYSNNVAMLNKSRMSSDATPDAARERDGIDECKRHSGDHDDQSQEREEERRSWNRSDRLLSPGLPSAFNSLPYVCHATLS